VVIIPRNEPEEVIDGYGGKDFEKGRVLTGESGNLIAGDLIHWQRQSHSLKYHSQYVASPVIFIWGAIAQEVCGTEFPQWGSGAKPR